MYFILIFLLLLKNYGKSSNEICLCPQCREGSLQHLEPGTCAFQPQGREKAAHALRTPAATPHLLLFTARLTRKLFKAIIFIHHQPVPLSLLVRLRGGSMQVCCFFPRPASSRQSKMPAFVNQKAKNDLSRLCREGVNMERINYD